MVQHLRLSTLKSSHTSEAPNQFKRVPRSMCLQLGSRGGFWGEESHQMEDLALAPWRPELTIFGTLRRVLQVTFVVGLLNIMPVPHHPPQLHAEAQLIRRLVTTGFGRSTVCSSSPS